MKYWIKGLKYQAVIVNLMQLYLQNVYTEKCLKIMSNRERERESQQEKKQRETKKMLLFFFSITKHKH